MDPPEYWHLRFDENWFFHHARFLARILCVRGSRKEELIMPNDAKTVETLQALNRGYLLAGEKCDVAWYAEHLAEDYMATNPDGSFVDRAGFLARFAKPHSLSNFRAPDVQIQLVGDVALIHASFEDTRPDGSTGKGRYTDIWALRGGRWLCVSAHFTRC